MPLVNSRANEGFSVANRNWASNRLYSMHVAPVLIDCNFVVDSTNGNGLGIRSLKGPAVQSVFMNTSATPAPGSPNPEAGVIVVRLQDNYNRYFGGFSGQVSALGSPQATVSAGVPYVVTSLGTATAAQWKAAGFPAAYLNPATGLPLVGAAFIATASLTIGGSASVAPSAAAGSNIDHVEVLGDPNQTIAPSSPSVGAQFVLQCFKGGVLTAPSNGSVISLAFYMSNSSVMVSGE